MRAACIVTVLVLHGAAAVVGAQGAEVETVFTPPEAVLPAGGSITVAITVANKSGRGIEDVRLEAIPQRGIGVRWQEGGGAPVLGTIEAGGSRVARVDILRDRASSLRNGLLFETVFRVRSEGPREAREVVVVSELRLKNPSAEPSTTLEMEVTSNIEKIEDRRASGLAFVVVRNKGDFPVQITDIRVLAPYFLEVKEDRERQGADPGLVGRVSNFFGGEREVRKSNGVISVGPRSDRVIPFRITAKAVEPGPHTVMWELDATWIEDGQQHERSLVGSKAFSAGVLGEQEILNLFGWPSLLLLPGALMVLTFLTLRKRLYPKKESDLSATKAEFWLLAVTFSLLAVLAYPKVTGKVGNPRDFLVLYSFGDIVNLWWGSVLVAIVVWGLAYGGRELLKRGVISIKELRAELTLPQRTDSPLKVLNKLRASGRQEVQSLHPRWVRVRESNQEGMVVFEDGGKLWIVPHIQIDTKSAMQRDKIQGAEEVGLVDFLETLKDLRDNEEGKGIQLHWSKEDGVIPGPLGPITEQDVDPVPEKQARMVRFTEAE